MASWGYYTYYWIYFQWAGHSRDQYESVPVPPITHDFTSNQRIAQGLERRDCTEA